MNIPTLQVLDPHRPRGNDLHAGLSSLEACVVIRLQLAEVPANEREDDMPQPSNDNAWLFRDLREPKPRICAMECSCLVQGWRGWLGK